VIADQKKSYVNHFMEGNREQGTGNRGQGAGKNFLLSFFLLPSCPSLLALAGRLSERGSLTPVRANGHSPLLLTFNVKNIYTIANY